MTGDTMWKILCPVEGKSGKTFWMRIGSAFDNRDGSKNLYLNAYPMNGKLQLRPLDAEDRARMANEPRPVEEGALPF